MPLTDFSCQQCDVYAALIDSYADVVQDESPPGMIHTMIIAFHGSGHRDPLS